MFVLTLNMPSKSGNSVHQMYVNHTSESLEDFMVYIADQLNNTDFILVDEYYKDNSTGSNEYYSIGETMVNTRFIGKVRMINARIRDNA
jgi:hypothetical protein